MCSIPQHCSDGIDWIKNRTLETQDCDGLWGLSPNTRKVDKNLALELEVLAEAKQDIQPGRLHF
jgi:hypothetical protein